MKPKWEYTKGENHVGQVCAHVFDTRMDKPVYVVGWWGQLYCKVKGSYVDAYLYADGRLGEHNSWTDLVLFDPWQRVADRRVMRVVHLIEATKQRLGVT